MTAAELIRDINRHSGDVTVDGHDVNLIAPQSLSTDLVDRLCTTT